jgi:hypothetical protein
MISVMKKIEKRLTNSQYIFDFVCYTPNLWVMPISENSMARDLDEIEFHFYPDQINLLSRNSSSMNNQKYAKIGKGWSVGKNSIKNLSKS